MQRNVYVISVSNTQIQRQRKILKGSKNPFLTNFSLSRGSILTFSYFYDFGLPIINIKGLYQLIKSILL